MNSKKRNTTSWCLAFPTITIMLAMGGCGSVPSEDKAVTSEVEVEVEVGKVLTAADITATKEITASENFLFETSSLVSVNIDISGYSTERAFLSICREKNDGEKIDYENCLLRAPLLNGQYNAGIEITNDQNTLLSEIWFYQEDGTPLKNTHYREIDGSYNIEILL